MTASSRIIAKALLDEPLRSRLNNGGSARSTVSPGEHLALKEVSVLFNKVSLLEKQLARLQKQFALSQRKGA